MFIGDAFLLGLGLVELLEYYISSEPKFGVAMFGAENNFSVEQFVPKFMLGFVFFSDLILMPKKILDVSDIMTL